MTHLTILERQVLLKLLSGEGEVLSILRRQAEGATVSERKMTGVGFFTNLEIPAHLPRLRMQRNLKLGDVNGTADNIKSGLGFLLYVNGGALSMLEGYTYDDPWPEEIHGLVLSYSKGSVRELDFEGRSEE